MSQLGSRGESHERLMYSTSVEENNSPWGLSLHVISPSSSIHTHTRTYAHLHACTHAHAHTHAHTHTHTHIHTWYTHTREVKVQVSKGDSLGYFVSTLTKKKHPTETFILTLKKVSQPGGVALCRDHKDHCYYCAVWTMDNYGLGVLQYS